MMDRQPRERTSLRSDTLWPSLGRMPLAAVGVLAILLSSLAPATTLAQDGDGHWVGTWATGPLALYPPPPSGRDQAAQAPAGLGAAARINNQTIRQIVHTSIGGSQVRVGAHQPVRY